jgi:hypothetical protein
VRRRKADAIGRLYVEGKLRERWKIFGDADVHAILMGFVERYDLLNHKHMVEIEFPALPVGQRYTRFGTDPSMMVNPRVIRPSRRGRKPCFSPPRPPSDAAAN